MEIGILGHRIHIQADLFQQRRVIRKITEKDSMYLKAKK